MKKFFDSLSKGAETIGGFLMLAMTLIVFLQVVARYVVGHSLTWSEEMARYLFVYITFLGAGVLTYQKGHLFVEVIFNLWPQKIQRIVQLIIDVIGIVLTGWMIYSAVNLMQTSTMHKSTAMAIPMNYIALSVLIGGILMTLFAIYNIYDDIVKIVKGESAGDTPVEKEEQY